MKNRVVIVGGKGWRPFSHKLKTGGSFLSRVRTLTRDIDIAILSVRPSIRLSVCPSVRDTLLLYENG